MDNAQLAARVEARAASLAFELTERHFRRRPELAARFGARGRARCAEDAGFHLRYLAQALALQTPGLFAEYLAWAVTMLDARGIAREDLVADMRELQELLVEQFPEDAPAVREVMGPALARLELPAPGRPPLGPAAQRYLEAMLKEGPIEARRVVEDLRQAPTDVERIYVDVLQAAMHEVGHRWQLNRLSVAEEHYCTAVTQRIVALLHSEVYVRRGRKAGVVVACVPGELHELGARMVADLLELDGYRTHYLGANMPPQAIVDVVSVERAHLLALSAGIVPHLGPVRQVINLARGNASTREVKIVVGGGAFNLVPDLWRRVGADGYAPDAGSAVQEVRRLAGE